MYNTVYMGAYAAIKVRIKVRIKCVYRVYSSTLMWVHVRFLRHDADGPPQVVQAKGGEVNAVNEDRPATWLYKAEERKRQRGLTAAGAPHKADLRPPRDIQRNASQRWVQLRAIPYLYTMQWCV